MTGGKHENQITDVYNTYKMVFHGGDKHTREPDSGVFTKTFRGLLRNNLHGNAALFLRITSFGCHGFVLSITCPSNYVYGMFTYLHTKALTKYTDDFIVMVFLKYQNITSSYLANK